MANRFVIGASNGVSIMSPGYIPPISINKAVSPFETTLPGVGSKFQLDMTPDTQKASFKDVMGKMVSSVNGAMMQPDKLMQDAMLTGNVDVHDVMIANAKSELMVNVTTQIATKVIQAYDRILQIQI